MPNRKGTIVLMGSGELTATMVEIHKARLHRLGQSPTAVFVDTPAGFQLNVDHISQKAVEYFKMRVQQSLQLASFKSAQIDSDLAREQTYALLRNADYILIGPGSPTYALEQWQQSPVPKMMIDCVEAGGCLVAASAAALTVGRFTLPVYEIYKVGTPVHWVDGLDLLSHFGFNIVVVPHWNNAEGGNHDTRYCFMGAPRLEQLESLLPTTVQILGLDEHTALVIELGASYATIEGIGRVTFRHQGREKVFQKGDQVPLALLSGEMRAGQTEPEKATPEAAPRQGMPPETDVWATIHSLADTVREALDLGRDEQVAGGLLELERHIWQSQRQLEERNEMGAAREVMREVIALLTARLSCRPTSVRACVAPLVDALVDLRQRLRQEKAWDMADAVRDCLLKANIQVVDTPTGASWQLTEG